MHDARMPADPEYFEWKAYYENEKPEFPYVIKVGYLKVPLSYDPDNPASQIGPLRLRVSAAFTANITDETKVLLSHCGGPGSFDTCGMSQGLGEHGYDNTFVSIGIAQRGVYSNKDFEDDTPEIARKIAPLNPDMQVNLGQALAAAPPLGSSTGPNAIPGATCTLKNGGPTWPPVMGHKYPPTDFLNMSLCRYWAPPQSYYDKGGCVPYSTDLTDDDSIRCGLDYLQATVDYCYQDERWQMMDLEGNKHNFLDFIGTRMLAQDIDRLRQAFGLSKISLSGFSCKIARPKQPDSSPPRWLHAHLNWQCTLLRPYGHRWHWGGEHLRLHVPPKCRTPHDQRKHAIWPW